jgi:uncharacterized protein (TIGR02118 family)
MITRLGVAPRRQGLEIEAFQAHWAGTHGSVVAHLQGVQRYWQNHAVLDEGEPLLAWPGFDACSDIDFPDLETMNAAFASDQYRDAVKADEAYLVDKTKGGLMVSRRIIVRGTPDAKGIRLWRFMRAARGVGVADLHAALSQAPALNAAHGQERLEALGIDETGIVPIFDAAETFWFADAPSALRALRSAEFRERVTAFSGLVRGSEHLIARIHVVPVSGDRQG